MKVLYHNRLPHIAPIGATFFVTFRLADSLPQSVILSLQQNLEIEINHLKREFPNDCMLRIIDARKRSFGKFDHQLDQSPYGDCYLQQPECANILVEKLLEYDGRYYDLQTYCIMPNHVHILLSTATQMIDNQGVWQDEPPADYVQLDKILQLIKGGSSFLINKRLKRRGRLWFRDSYDHYVRNEKEWLNIAVYILNNPVKAGLCKSWDHWKFNFCKPSLQEYLMFR